MNRATTLIRTRRGAVALLTTATLALTACGGDANNDVEPTPFETPSSIATATASPATTTTTQKPGEASATPGDDGNRPPKDDDVPRTTAD